MTETNFKYKLGKESDTGKADNKAGYLKEDGHVYIDIDGKEHLASKLIFLYMKGYYPEGDIEYIDGDKTNLKWDNLQEIKI